MYGIDIPGTRAPGEGAGDAIAQPPLATATATANVPRDVVGVVSHPPFASAAATLNVPDGVAGALSHPTQASAAATVTDPAGATGAPMRPAAAEASAYLNAPMDAAGTASQPAQLAAAASVAIGAAGVGVTYRAGNRQVLRAGIAVPGERAPGEAPQDETLIVPAHAIAAVGASFGVGVNYPAGNRFVIRSGVHVPGDHAPGEPLPGDVNHSGTLAALARSNVPFILARLRRPRASVTSS